VSGSRVAVVLKRSYWRKWVEELHDPHIESLVESHDETVSSMLPGHLEHAETVEETRSALADLGVDASWFDRPHDFRMDDGWDLVVTVGGDGTLLAASHGIGPDVPLLGVNSAPGHSVGFFCGASKGGVKSALDGALHGRLRRAELTRMRVELNGHTLHARVLNEALFCHASPAATSRYFLRVLELGNVPGGAGAGRVLDEEEQKSSGVWVGPAAGSTAAQRSAGGHIQPLSSTGLQYVVREPYVPGQGCLRMALGLVEEGVGFALRSKMRQARLFLDGDHIVHPVTIGDLVLMRRSDEPLVVLGLARNGEP
jgi:NAD+ kinase